jgi:hypothetical protein
MMTVHYSVIETATGEILKTGTCPDSDLEKQAEDGQYVVAHQLDTSGKKLYINGKEVDK